MPINELVSCAYLTLQVFVFLLQLSPGQGISTKQRDVFFINY